ncbi:MAG: efflux RND transporter periplasmic adaptor subunit [Phycisphaerae bacterium]
MKKIVLIVLLIGLVGGAGVYLWNQSGKSSTIFRTAKVSRGDLLVTIGATGTVEPQDVIDVGAQVAGKIEYFGNGPDGKPVDYGSPVEEGTVLAHIDDSLYKADLDQSDAQLEQAKANVLRAQADLGQMKAKLHQAEKNWVRAKELGPSRALSATDYDSYEAAYETAKATLAVGEATVIQTQKSVLQAEAALKRFKRNIDYCTIISPVKGVIIDRRVNIGQTVVSSLNAPSLFLIAADLKKMQVWTAVNEADIGSIHPGQSVSFHVDAYPNQTFRGTVGKIRLNASMTQNVVTYTVEINTDNSDGILLPYLTANVLFEIAQRKNIIMVPNSALRWTPSLEQVVPEARQSLLDSEQGKISTTRKAPGAAKRGLIWVKAESLVRPMEVIVGLSDKIMTEIQADNLKEGIEVVVGESEGTQAEGTTNPFTPKLFGKRPPPPPP